MAEETSPANSNGEVKRDYAIAATLGAVILSIAGIAGYSMVSKLEQWDVVTDVLKGLFILANTLAGGLLMKTKA